MDKRETLEERTKEVEHQIEMTDLTTIHVYESLGRKSF